MGKKVSRVALLTGCVQRVISPEINEVYYKTFKQA